MLREHSALNEQALISDSSENFGKSSPYIHKIKQNEKLLLA